MPSIVPPAFQFYARDWIASSTRAMSLAARGAYTDLLAFSWLQDGLPVDPDTLRRLVGATEEEWARIWPDIEHEWPVVDGRRRNERQESERTALADYKAQCERGGKARASTAARDGGKFTSRRPAGHQPATSRSASPTPADTTARDQPSTSTAICILRTATASTEISESEISVARAKDADHEPTAERPPSLTPLTRAELLDESPRARLLARWREVAEAHGVVEPLTSSAKVVHQANALLQVHPPDVLERAVVAFWDSPEFEGKRNFGLFASQAGQIVAHVRSGTSAPFGAKVIPRAGVHGSKTTQNAASLAAFVDTMRRRAAP